MKTKDSLLLLRVPDPFGDSAKIRLAHMGIVDERFEILNTSMLVFAGIFSGLFYDDICDFYSDPEEIRAICDTLSELLKKEDYHHMYLFISLQYDCIRKPLPDPVWWLAGDSAAVRVFMAYFSQRLNEIMATERAQNSKPEGETM